MIAGQVLREVRLYGHLGRRFGRVHRLAVDTPREAVHALSLQQPGLRQALLDHQAGFHVLVGDGRREHDRGQDDIDVSLGSMSIVRIVPVVEGAKKGWAKVVLGAALMVLAPYAAGALFGAGAAVGVSVGVSTYGVSIGKALLLGGLVQLLSPQPPKQSSPTEKETSFSFNGPINTVAGGGPVPIAIGRLFVGSVTISAGLTTDELAGSAVSVPAAPPIPPHMTADPTTQNDY